MSPRSYSKSDSNQPHIYQIRIQGHLDSQWSDWFEDLTIAPQEDGTTLLTGPVVDDAALHGLLKKVRDLGMPLLSVNRVGTEQGDQGGDDIVQQHLRPSLDNDQPEEERRE